MNSPDRWTNSLHLAPVVDEELDGTLSRISNVAVRELPECTMAGITLIRGQKPVTTAFTDPQAAEIDAAQYETGAGPCLDAFRDGEVFRIPDTRSETRWPEFARAAAAHGILSTLSLPLAVNEETLGALNLYSSSAHGFLDEEVPLLFASHASVVLANSQAYWAAHALSMQLETALTSRAVIDQAKGILMAKYGCTADEAFRRLSDDSQQSNRKLRDIAQETVDAAVHTAQDAAPPD